MSDTTQYEGKLMGICMLRLMARYAAFENRLIVDFGLKLASLEVLSP